MSHTLALWPGSPPADAASACREYSLRMLSRGIEWSRSATVPEQDARMLAFCRAAGRLLLSEPGGRASPLRDPSEVGTLWGEVLTLEFDGPQPLALAGLVRLAADHGCALFDLHAHRVLTTADVSTAFGAPMVPVPARLDIGELITRCHERGSCCEELEVLPTGLLNCSQALDPFLVTPIQQELETFRTVLDLLGCHDLEDLQERLGNLLLATEDDPFLR